MCGRAWVWLGCLLWLGCGDPLLVGPEYRGEPIYTLEGSVILGEEAAFPILESQTPKRLALVWSDSENLQAVDLQDQTFGMFPAAFTFSLTQPAPRAFAGPFEDGEAAAGFVIVYEDANGDRTYQREERVVGLDPESVVLYVFESLTHPTTGERLAPGFHLLMLADCFYGGQGSRWSVAREGAPLLVLLGEVPGLEEVNLACDGGASEELCVATYDAAVLGEEVDARLALQARALSCFMELGLDLEAACPASSALLGEELRRADSTLEERAAAYGELGICYVDL